MAEQVHFAMTLDTTDCRRGYRAEIGSCLRSTQVNVRVQMHGNVAEHTRKDKAIYDISDVP